jgi:hypothetical protein
MPARCAEVVIALDQPVHQAVAKVQLAVAPGELPVFQRGDTALDVMSTARRNGSQSATGHMFALMLSPAWSSGERVCVMRLVVISS